jgi:lipoprotein-anchoring transpeptidase ErfK/SrfK
VAACGGGGDDDDADSGSEDPAPDEAEGAAELPADHVWVAEARGPTTEVFSEVNAEGEPMETLPSPNENGSPLTFLVDGTDVEGELIPVLLPVPPNGTQGWVRAGDVELFANPYHITVELAAHRLTVSNAGEVEVETTVAVGQDGRETPTGLYYVKELIQPPDPNGIYGPYAYGISGFTNNPEVAAEFGEGGVIGIHGTNDPAALGTDVSSGCIRMANEVITELAGYLPLGTPVEIMA